jgi:hypothetical protein
MKVPEGTVPARPERTAVTHPERSGPDPEPFADKVREIITALGEDNGREGLLKTPERVEKSLRFLTQGYWMTVEDVVGDAVFEERHQSMIMVRDIELYSLCEHHMLPFFGRAHVAYIPNGKILGLSKVARIVDVFARRLHRGRRGDHCRAFLHDDAGSREAELPGGDQRTAWDLPRRLQNPGRVPSAGTRRPPS